MCVRGWRNEYKVITHPRTDTTHNADLAILGEATREGYERIRRQVMIDFNIGKDELPSYFRLTKNRPNIITLSITPNTTRFCSTDTIFSNVLGVDTSGHILTQKVVAEPSSSGTEIYMSGMMDVESSSLLNGLNVEDEWTFIEALKMEMTLVVQKYRGHMHIT